MRITEIITEATRRDFLKGMGAAALGAAGLGTAGKSKADWETNTEYNEFDRKENIVKYINVDRNNVLTLKTDGGKISCSLEIRGKNNDRLINNVFPSKKLNLSNYRVRIRIGSEIFSGNTDGMRVDDTMFIGLDSIAKEVFNSIKKQQNIDIEVNFDLEKYVARFDGKNGKVVRKGSPESQYERKYYNSVTVFIDSNSPMDSVDSAYKFATQINSYLKNNINALTFKEATTEVNAGGTVVISPLSTNEAKFIQKMLKDKGYAAYVT